MVVVYTTGDGKAYTAADGTILVVGGGLSLITDRLASDVEKVRFLAEAIKTGTATEEQVRQYLDVHQKGAYTYEDLNRVEDAVAYLAERLKGYGYLHHSPIIRHWSMENKPNHADFARYFGNIATLRNAIAVLETTPEAPVGVVGFGVEQANALEQILTDIDVILNRMMGAWFYSGDLYLAEV